MSLLDSAKKYLDTLPPDPVRAEAWRRMEQTGLPNRKTETWKYSSLAPLDKMQWTVAGAAAGQLPLEWASRIREWQKSCDVAVIINGEFEERLSNVGQGFTVSRASLSEFNGEDGFSNLNQAIAATGIRIEAAGGRKFERPLVLFKYQSASAWTSHFHEIKIGTNSELSVFEILCGTQEKYLRTDLNRIQLGENTQVRWLRRQQESKEAYHFGETQIDVPANARMHFTAVHRGSKWLRGQMKMNLTGAGAEAYVHGMTFGEGEQHNDQRIVVAHTAGNTTSGQLFKGVFKERARGAMNGKIFIAQDAQKVSSMQMNHNLLLSPGAEANTKPELEIYADDVKANHGATVGRLDEEKMFYLRSRGLTTALAEKLLSEAFTHDVFMKIPDARLRAFAEAEYA